MFLTSTPPLLTLVNTRRLTSDNKKKHIYTTQNKIDIRKIVYHNKGNITIRRKTFRSGRKKFSLVTEKVSARDGKNVTLASPNLLCTQN